jgi:uncharacterized protein (DUF433 family)
MDFSRITRDPAVMNGKPCIRGLHATVSTILGLLAEGRTPEEILQAHPHLEREDIQAALAYAARETDAPLYEEPMTWEAECWEQLFRAPT